VGKGAPRRFQLLATLRNAGAAGVWRDLGAWLPPRAARAGGTVVKGDTLRAGEGRWVKGHRTGEARGEG